MPREKKPKQLSSGEIVESFKLLSVIEKVVVLDGCHKAVQEEKESLQQEKELAEAKLKTLNGADKY